MSHATQQPDTAKTPDRVGGSIGSDLTAEESRWLKKVKRVMDEMPDGFCLYNIDWDITVCKRGVSSNEFSQTIKCPITSGTMLTDLHDDNPKNGPNMSSAAPTSGYSPKT